MKKKISWVEVIIILILVFLIVKVWTYKIPKTGEKNTSKIQAPGTNNGIPKNFKIHSVGIYFDRDGYITEQTCPECREGNVRISSDKPWIYCTKCDWGLSPEKAREQKYNFEINYCCPECNKKLETTGTGFRCSNCGYSSSIEELRKQGYYNLYWDQ